MTHLRGFVMNENITVIKTPTAGDLPECCTETFELMPQNMASEFVSG